MLVITDMPKNEIPGSASGNMLPDAGLCVVLTVPLLSPELFFGIHL
jgi:hypothetical protein